MGFVFVIQVELAKNSCCSDRAMPENNLNSQTIRVTIEE